MIKKIILIILNAFNFKKPGFAVLHYADVVINDNSFFLISWELKNGYRLQIPGLNYQTITRKGSAYIAVPKNIDEIELITFSLWRSDRKTIRLIRETIDAQINFYPENHFEGLYHYDAYNPNLDVQVPAPNMRLRTNNLHVRTFMITTKNLNPT